MALERRQHAVLRQIGVVLDLVGDQRFRTDPHRLVEHGDGEIRHSDMARQPAALGLGERAERLRKQHFRLRPVHQQEVDIIELQRFQAGLGRAQEVGLARIQFGHFGGNPELVARDAAGADAFADALLGAVFARGVDQAVAVFDGGGDQLRRVIGQLHGAVADRRHFCAVRGESEGLGWLHWGTPAAGGDKIQRSGHPSQR